MKKSTWLVVIVVSLILVLLCGCLSFLLVRQLPDAIVAIKTEIVKNNGTATRLPVEILTEIPTKMPTEKPTEVKSKTPIVEWTTSTPQQSETVNAAETENPMEEQIQLLLTDGVITSAEGEYIRLDNFDKKWAQRNWFRWWSTGYSPINFVLRGEAEWNSDPGDKTPELGNSGCGVIFHTTDANHFYLAYIGLDGKAYLQIMNGVYLDTISSGRYGEYAVNGKGSFILVVEDEWMTFYVNGKKVIRQSARTLPSGDLALTLLSGTNKGYGTQCKMSDLDLWIMKDGPSAKEKTYQEIELPYLEDFEDNQLQGWDISQCKWMVAAENNNHFWQLKNQEEDDYSFASLFSGSDGWEDYSFESKIRFNQGWMAIDNRIKRNSAEYLETIFDVEVGKILIIEYDHLAQQKTDQMKTIWEGDYNLTRNQWYSVRFDMVGDQISLFINDDAVATVQSEHRDRGDVRVYLGSDSEADMDDIQIMDLKE